MSHANPPPPYPGNVGKLSAVPPEDEAAQPLLGSPVAGTSAAGGIYNQPALGDVPDDFKVFLALALTDGMRTYTLVSMELLCPSASFPSGMPSCARCIASFVCASVNIVR